MSDVGDSPGVLPPPTISWTLTGTEGAIGLDPVFLQAIRDLQSLAREMVSYVSPEVRLSLKMDERLSRVDSVIDGVLGC